MNFINKKYINKWLYITLFMIFLLFNLNLNAQSLRTYGLLDKRRDTVVLIPQVIDYPSFPNAGSIWINRESPYNEYTPEEYISKVFIKSDETSCSEISNVTFIGMGWNGTSWNNAERSLSYFSHGTLNGLGIEEGLLLTTGGGLRAEGPNSMPDGLDGGVDITDTDLSDMIPGYSIKAGAILQFDFIPQKDTIVFDYIFASEEYPEYVDLNYNDVFGFFISGPGITGTKNIALIPGTNIPVAINNINDHLNFIYYRDNYWSQYTEYDGQTVLLSTAAVVVTPGQTYHLKLAIANVGDNRVGSGVFLKAKSFDMGFDIKNYGGMIADMDNIFAGCSNNKLVVKTNYLPYPSTINLTYSGTAISDIVQPDNSPMPTTITVPANTSQIDIPYKVKDAVSVNGGTFTISYISNCSGLLVEKNIYVYSKTTAQLITANTCNSDGTIQATAIGGSASVQMSIDNGINWQIINKPFTGLNAGIYTVLIRDSISCHIDTLFDTIYNEKPIIDTIYNKNVCSGTNIPEIIFNSSITGTTFSWTNNNANIGLAASGTGNISAFTATNTTNEVITATVTVTPTYITCDGVPYAFKITVNPVYDTTINATICLGERYQNEYFGFDTIPTQTGTINSIQNLLTISSCDSIITLNLKINPVYDTLITAEICLGDRYKDDNFDTIPTQAGTVNYNKNPKTKNGCDSIFRLELIVHPSYHNLIKDTICLNEYYNENEFYITPSQSGVFTYIHDLKTNKNCDSITVLELTVNQAYNEYVSAQIYEDEYYNIGNYQYNTPGLHISNLQTIEGCDSIINLTLDVIYYPSEITAFSPFNKDGINDYFMAGFKIQIFNRYGQHIYEPKTTEEQERGWAGQSNNGQNVEPGMYFYILYNSSGKPLIKSSVEVLKK